MKNKLFYILGLATAVLSSCHDDEVFDTLSGTAEKTPLPVTVALSTGNNSVQTRAVDKEFAAGDELLVYIEHVSKSGSVITSVGEANMAPALVKFSVNSGDMIPDGENKQKTSNLKLENIFHNGNVLDDRKKSTQDSLYWDDFSDSSSDATDLRTEGHGLRPKYGYCYNGGEADRLTTALNATEGTLGWTIATDQTSEIKTNDLLWSKTPDSYVSYSHGSQKDEEHGMVSGKKVGLSIPYTHAMSKVTIILVPGDGFTGDELNSDNLKVTLDKMYTNCTVAAPGQTITKNEVSEMIKDIQMFNGSITVGTTQKPTRAFEAIVVPGKVWEKNSPIAVIEGMDCNKYNIVATESIIAQFLKKDSWTESDKVTLESGKNYKLTITVDKQPQTIEAKITNWEDVSATGTGEIVFANDITTKGDIVEALKTGGFDVYKSSVNTSFGDKNTTLQWVDSKWKYDPIVYWAGQGDSAYFRALAPAGTTTTISQGNDILWGYACDKNEDIDKVGTATEVKITPRTGDIPLTFKHAMSKITVNLETSSAESPDHVDLAGAKISIASIYNTGTISLKDGSISDLKLDSGDPAVQGFIPIREFFAANDGTEGTKLKDYVVIPQSLVDMNNGSEPTPRNGTVSFYNKAELTKIADKYYVTSTLGPTYYSEEEVIAHNADIAGAVTVGAPLTYTYEQFKNLKNSEVTEELFNYLIASGITPAITYSQYIALTESKPFDSKDEEEFITIRTSATNNGWWTHNAVSAKAYNAKLPGALHITDQKGYEVVTDSKEANPGDLKVNNDNPKVMMLIMLKDGPDGTYGTTYTLDLAKCKDNTDQVITKWERGKHYTYTITLAKEKITFRALIKNWEEKTGSGNATLDWD